MSTLQCIFRLILKSRKWTCIHGRNFWYGKGRFFSVSLFSGGYNAMHSEMLGLCETSARLPIWAEQDVCSWEKLKKRVLDFLSPLSLFHLSFSTTKKSHANKDKKINFSRMMLSRHGCLIGRNLFGLHQKIAVRTVVALLHKRNWKLEEHKKLAHPTQQPWKWFQSMVSWSLIHWIQIRPKLNCWQSSQA